MGEPFLWTMAQLMHSFLLCLQTTKVRAPPADHRSTYTNQYPLNLRLRLQCAEKSSLRNEVRRALRNAIRIKPSRAFFFSVRIALRLKNK
jgi:hypothetical protein